MVFKSHKAAKTIPILALLLLSTMAGLVPVVHAQSVVQSKTSTATGVTSIQATYSPTVTAFNLMVWVYTGTSLSGSPHAIPSDTQGYFSSTVYKKPIDSCVTLATSLIGCIEVYLIQLGSTVGSETVGFSTGVASNMTLTIYEANDYWWSNYNSTTSQHGSGGSATSPPLGPKTSNSLVIGVVAGTNLTGSWTPTGGFTVSSSSSYGANEYDTTYSGGVTTLPFPNSQGRQWMEASISIPVSGSDGIANYNVGGPGTPNTKAQYGQRPCFTASDARYCFYRLATWGYSSCLDISDCTIASNWGSYVSIGGGAVWDFWQSGPSSFDYVDTITGGFGYRQGTTAAGTISLGSTTSVSVTGSIFALTVSRDTSGNIFVAVSVGASPHVFESIDDGATFNQIFNQPSPPSCIDSGCVWYATILPFSNGNMFLNLVESGNSQFNGRPDWMSTLSGGSWTAFAQSFYSYDNGGFGSAAQGSGNCVTTEDTAFCGFPTSATDGNGHFTVLKYVSGQTSTPSIVYSKAGASTRSGSMSVKAGTPTVSAFFISLGTPYPNYVTTQDNGTHWGNAVNVSNPEPFMDDIYTIGGPGTFGSSYQIYSGNHTDVSWMAIVSSGFALRWTDARALEPLTPTSVTIDTNPSGLSNAFEVNGTVHTGPYTLTAHPGKHYNLTALASVSVGAGTKVDGFYSWNNTGSFAFGNPRSVVITIPYTNAHYTAKYWNVSASSSATVTHVGTSVTFTATSTISVSSTGKYLGVWNVTGSVKIVSCNTGTTCSISVPSNHPGTQTFMAWVGNQNNPDSLANSSLITVQWVTPIETIVFQVSPAGLNGPFTLDGTHYATSIVVVHWTIGSTHTISAASSVTNAALSTFSFSHWSIGGTSTQSYTVTNNATLTAYYSGGSANCNNPNPLIELYNGCYFPASADALAGPLGRGPWFGFVLLGANVAIYHKTRAMWVSLTMLWVTGAVFGFILPGYVGQIAQIFLYIGAAGVGLRLVLGLRSA